LLQEVSKLARQVQDAERQEHKTRETRAATAGAQAAPGGSAPPAPVSSPAGAGKPSAPAPIPLTDTAGAGEDVAKPGASTPGKAAAAGPGTAAATTAPGTPALIGGSATPAPAVAVRAEASAQMLLQAMLHGKRGTPLAFKLQQPGPSRLDSKGGSKGEEGSSPGSPDEAVVVVEVGGHVQRSTVKYSLWNCLQHGRC
jgi:hypothetical protein